MNIDKKMKLLLAVTDIKETIIENTPSLGVSINKNFITGMAKMTDGVTTLLDIEKILSGE